MPSGTYIVQCGVKCVNFYSTSSLDILAGMAITNNEGKDLTVRGILLCATMDAPAKCLMQNFVYYNGFSGCPYCLEQETSVKTSAKGHTHAYPFNGKSLHQGYDADRSHENTLVKTRGEVFTSLWCQRVFVVYVYPWI